MPSPIERIKSAYNAFMGRDPTKETIIYQGGSWGGRPDRTRHIIQNERSIVHTVLNRIAIDAASINIKHVRVDENGEYKSDIKSSLNRLLSIEANVDQTGRALITDLVYSMLDDGVVALFPTDLSQNPWNSDAYEVLEARVAKITDWYPKHVRLECYNENSGRREYVVAEKRFVPIIENPFYSIMNEPNSTLQRLIRSLNQLDRFNELNSSGKMDLIIQLPYITKTASRLAQAEERRKSIEAQLTGSKYGIAYIDGTEKIVQLNRSLENNLWDQVKGLKEELLSELGLTVEILNGTAKEDAMTNYYSRIVEPILTTISEEIERKWLSKTSQTRGQAIRYFRDPFKLVPVNTLAEIADKLTRNEIMSSNEIRMRIGLAPSDDPKADELVNSNMPQSSMGSELSKSDEVSEEGESEQPKRGYNDVANDVLDSLNSEIKKILKEYDPDFVDDSDEVSNEETKEYDDVVNDVLDSVMNEIEDMLSDEVEEEDEEDV